MAWKEGVEAEAVHKYRALVQYARKLDEQIDDGLITPKEAHKALADAVAVKKEKSE